MNGVIHRICKKIEIINSMIDYKASLHEGRAIVKDYSIDFQKPQSDLGAIHVLTNGPSLSHTIKYLNGTEDVMTVNFSLRDEKIRALKPKYHVLIDETFASVHIDYLNEMASYISDGVVGKLYLSSAVFDAWKRTYPTKDVRVINTVSTGLEYNSKRDYSNYLNNYLSPSAQTVSIMALYIAVLEGYRTIYLHGNDFTWMKDLYVGIDNIVCDNNQHFYSESNKRGISIPMIKWARCFYNAYIGYNQIASFSLDSGARIINLCPSSMVDVFEKRTNLLDGEE